MTELNTGEWTLESPDSSSQQDSPIKEVRDYKMAAREYRRNRGFLLATDTGHKVVEAVAGLRIDKVNPSPAKLRELHAETTFVSGSAIGLAQVAIELSKAVKTELYGDSEDVTNADVRLFDARFGVTEEDRSLEINKFEFESGLVDQEFTWHFAPALAVDVACHFQAAGWITREQLNNLTFGDYADMIRSTWFKDLVHDLALTENSLYGEMGMFLHHYLHEALLDRIVYWIDEQEPGEQFDLHKVRNEDDGRTYFTASLTKSFRRFLRNRMKRAGSVGCPVVRRAGTLATSLVAEDPHAQALAENRHITFTPTDNPDKVRFTHEYTPIDRALDVLAAQLDAYDKQHGTPYASKDRVYPFRIDHMKQPKTNALSCES